MALHLITGAAGFIGSNLLGRLLESGQSVIAVDNLSTGSKANLAQYEKNPNLKFIQKDVESFDITEKVDQIWHLACPASPVHYQANPIKTIRTCYEGTVNVLEIAKRCKAPILIASTSEVYGDPLIHPQTEEYLGNVNTLGPRACYDEGKRIAETIAFNYWSEYGVKVKIARIFNTYGPNMSIDDGRVVSNFIAQALQNKPITIYGDGSTTRSFCFVDDTVDALQLIAGSSGKLTYNVGNPNEISLMDLADLIKSLTWSISGITYKARPQDDPKRRMPDISKIQSEIGWEPSVSLMHGLARTILYFKKVLASV